MPFEVGGKPDGWRIAIRVLLAVGVVGIVGLIFAFGWLSHSIDDELARSRSFSAKVVGAVGSDWGRSTFDALATPEFVTAHKRGKYDAGRYLQLLGSLRTSGRCDNAGMSIVNGSGWSKWSCPASFEGGAATLVMMLSLSGGQWQLADFAVQI